MNIDQVIFSDETVLSDEIQERLSDPKPKELLEFVSKNFPKPFHVSVCPKYVFKASEFKPVGGFSLPAEIPMPATLNSKFGASKLITYGLRFENSPIGLENIDFSLRKDSLILELRASYELTKIEDMLKNSYEIADHMANLMVVKINDEAKV